MENNNRLRDIVKKQLVIIGIIILLVCLGLSGCSNLLCDKNKFIGVWNGTYHSILLENTSANITFLSDGTYSANIALKPESGTWEIKDGKIVKIDMNNSMTVYTYHFSELDKSLILNSTTIYEKWIMMKK